MTVPTTLFNESAIKSNLRFAMASVVREAHEMTTDQDMTTEEAKSALQFIENNLGELEDRFTEIVTEMLVNNF